MNDIRSEFLSIKSLAGASCRIQTSIVDELKVLGVDPIDVKMLDDGLVELNLSKGSQAIVASVTYAAGAGDYMITRLIWFF